MIHTKYTPVDLSSIMDQNILDEYLNGCCGLLASSLSRLSGWPKFVIKIDESPVHVVIMAPGNEFTLDINGFHPVAFQIGYWKQQYKNILWYDEEDKDRIPQITIVPLDAEANFYIKRITRNSDYDDRMAKFIWETVMKQQ